MEIFWPSRRDDNQTCQMDTHTFIIKDEKDLLQVINCVGATSKTLLNKAQDYLDSLMKPPKSLGRLEEISAKLYAIRYGATNLLSKRCVMVFCADNGIVEEGVASAPQETTLFMTQNFTKGITGMCVLSQAYGADVDIVDVGIKGEIKHSKVTDMKIMKGTNNFSKEAAMTREDCVKAIAVGIKTACQAKINHYDLLGVGEMGIGNTTTAAAVLSAITGANAIETCGKGAGLDNESYNKKVDIINNAIEKYDLNKDDIIGIISKVGGLDIAAMTGAYIGAAFYRLPVVADGFISTVAALAACILCPNVKDYLFLSHSSYEKGYKLAAKTLGLEPVLDLNMRLGEGSGCPIMFSVMDGALAVYNNMGTFAEGNISDEYVDKIQDDSQFEVK